VTTLDVARKNWRKVWREGFAPLMPTEVLIPLRDALRADDPRLVQGSTTTPPPLTCVQDWPVEAACAIGYVAWRGDNLDTVGDVEERFGRYCFDADQRLGEAAACRYFLQWFDDAPRPEVLADLAAEVQYELERREATASRAAEPLEAVAR
jgi:hypothetical protein